MYNHKEQAYKAIIESIGHDGDGLVMLDNKKYYIPFSAPGDIVSFSLVQNNKNYELKDLEYIAMSIDRQMPVCESFLICGGCKLQHLSDALYNEYKLSMLNKALEFFDLTIDHIEPLIRLPAYKRRRITLSFSINNRKADLGYMMRNSSKIINIKTCHLVTKEIDIIIPELKILLQNLFPSVSKSGKIYILQSDSGLDIIIETDKNRTKYKEKDTSLEQSDIKSLLTDFIHKNKISKISLDSRYQAIQEEIVMDFCGHKIPISAKQFLQTSKEADLTMQEIVKKYLPSTFKMAADLFSGVGTFSFLLLNYCHVDAFELNDEAIFAVNHASRVNSNNIAIYKRNLFAHPLKANELKKYDLIIINPPRAGAIEQIEELTKNNSIKTIIYISCNPGSFARDAQILQNSGFITESITPLDQFIWSEHLELIAKFVRP